MLFPLSFGQQHMWLINHMFPDTPLFNLHNAFRLRFAVDPATAECAINEVVRRHETLRTTIRMVDDQPMQVVRPALFVPLPVVSLEGGPGDAPALNVLMDEATGLFNLEAGPLFRV